MVHSVYKYVTDVVQANPGIKADDLAELIERHARTSPILGHLVIEQMLDDGQLSAEEHDDQIRFSATSPHPSAPEDELAK